MASVVSRASASTRTLEPLGARRSRDIGPLLVFLALLIAGLAVALVASSRLYQPYFALAWGCFVVLLAAWLRFPRAALAATLTLTLIADTVTVSWFPFNKNLSSWESIMYLSNGVSLSPLEITVLWALAVTGYRNLARTGRPFVGSPLLPALVAFGAFTVFGLAFGLGRGGDFRAAMFEARPILLLPLLYLLVINVCRTRADYRRMFWAACVGILIQALLSLDYLFRLPGEDRASLERLTSHGSSIGMNLVIILTICAVAYVGVSGRLRLALVLSAVPITWVLIVGQRRAGVIALVIGLTLLAVMLFWRQRRTFWKLVPVVTVVVIGYTGAFWNSQSSAGFPAQAIKSVVAPESTSERNQSSDYYRVIERLNINETIRSSPVLGIGFGQPFLRPYYLADISVFEFNAYVPHNSFLYIWTKLGFAGFVTLLYLIARTMMQGAARARAAPYGPDAVVALGGVVFVAMFALFLYVDIAWESRNVFLLALSMALCTGHLADEARSRSDDLSTEQNPVSSSA